MGQEVKEPNPLLLARNSYLLYEILGALCALNPTLDSQIKLTGTLGASTLENERTEGSIGGIAPLPLIQIIGSSTPLVPCFGEIDPKVWIYLHRPRWGC